MATSVGSPVLVVDDDPIQHSLVEALVVNRLNGHVLHAMNGKEAAALIRPRGVHLSLIVLDLNMPDLDGIEFLALLHSHGVKAPVIITSGAPESLRRSAEVLAKVQGVNLIGSMAKPLNMALFTPLAAAALSQRAQIAS